MSEEILTKESEEMTEEELAEKRKLLLNKILQTKKRMKKK